MEELINNLGYPAAISIAMGYFLKYVFDKYAKQTEEVIKIVENNTEAITSFKEELIDIVELKGKEGEKDCETCSNKFGS